MTSEDGSHGEGMVGRTLAATTGASTADDRAVTRRMRRTTMFTAFIAIAPLGIVATALTSDTWIETVALSLGLLATFPILTEWSIDGYPRRSAWALSLSAIVWVFCAASGRSPMGFFAVALVGAILLARLPHRRVLATSGFSLAVGLIGTTAFLTQSPSWVLLDQFVILPVGGTILIVAIVMVSEGSWLLVRRLERAKETEAALVIARERMRFAGDLHDIQGHTLHVIKFKVALAQRLMREDPDRAGAELDEVRGLIADTIDKTRDLAYSRHELNLAAELANALLLCEAAGIQVSVRQDDLAGPAHPLLAHVLREATTNLLRHAHPTMVSITASVTRVEITNDGATDEPVLNLRGLARLEERLELAGGALQIHRSPGHFTVSAELSTPATAEVGIPAITTHHKETP